MEVKLALIEVLKKYKFVQAPDTEVGLKGSIHVTTVRYYYLYMTLYYRFLCRLLLD